MSLDEKLFSWLYKKLPQGQDKTTTLVPTEWEATLSIVASSIFARKIDVLLADEAASFDHLKLVLNRRHSIHVERQLVRQLYYYQMFFYRMLEINNLQMITSAQVLKLHHHVVTLAPDFKPLFEELSRLLPEVELFLKSGQAHPLLWNYIWPREFFVAKNAESSSTYRSTETQSQAKGKTIEAPTKKRPKKVKIIEQKENPLLHVFEKVITIENFHGGDRAIEDAEDLAADDQALQEIKLDTMIRSQDYSAGLIKSDVVIESELAEETSDIPLSCEMKMYQEWFYKENRYRNDWVKMHILYPKVTGEIVPLNDRVDLELAFDTPLWVKGCKMGSELDLPRVIDWQSTPMEQRDDRQRFFLEKRPQQEDSAFLFLLDQSLSTDTWIGDTHVLSLLKDCVGKIAPALSDAEVPYMVASFSSLTRHNVQFSVIKEFERPMQDLGRNLSDVAARGYTRLGPALRHSCQILQQRSERKKYLVLLSDCKPTDYDAYEGEHGYQDVLKAIEELRAQDIEVLIYSAQQERASWLRFRLKNAHFFSFRNSQEWLEQFFEIICLER